MTDAVIEKALKTYNVEQWSGGYFSINATGQLCLQLNINDVSIQQPLDELVQVAQAQGLKCPILMRFTNILHDRIKVLNQAFAQAMYNEHYHASYTAAYPIKVNQQRRVVEEIVKHHGESVGLEAGSKPELLAVMALAESNNTLIICNGYKDREYIRLALIGRALGKPIFIIVEKLSELDLIFEEAKKLNVTPYLGIRARLASIGKGKWQNTGGEKAKFGLSAPQILEAVSRLKQHNALTWLRALHFHMGSQIANIRDIQTGLKEAAQFYFRLRELGAPLDFVDVGGGLGVDYEGTQSRSDCSINYSISQYATHVVRAFAEICATYDLAHPHIISEAGRAMVAHHAVLVSNIIDVETSPNQIAIQPLQSDEPLIIHDLWRIWKNLSSRTALEGYHDVMYYIGEVNSLFAQGILSLIERARAEQIYFCCLHKIQHVLDPLKRVNHDILEELREKLATKYFFNFSLFQSIPDVWAIQQVFPIMPLSRLNEPLNEHGILQDLTCDSDGRIDRYVDGECIENTLALPEYKETAPYYLGIFLVGAYQEILGDMHNLFGDTATINVTVNDQQEVLLEEPTQGDDVKSVLNYVHLDAGDLLLSYQKQLSTSTLSTQQQSEFLAEFKAGLEGYTYFEDE